MMLPLEILRHGNATSFLRRAEEWLTASEAENNLLLGIAYRLSVSTDGYEHPLYLATIERYGEVVGCAFRTPPFKLGLTDMPIEAVDMLVEDVAAVYLDLPAVLGPEPLVSRFAQAWASRRRLSFRAGMKQRLYKLERTTPLERKVSGSMRMAGYLDVDLMASWIDGFTRDTGIPTARPRDLAELLVDFRAAVLWDDDGSKSMAGTQGETGNGVRISYVYTPNEHRGRGYASALVYELSRLQLNSGKKFCVLFTDLSNPISNAIYQKIGYIPLCDTRDYEFVE